jgi:hypothetical protein
VHRFSIEPLLLQLIQHVDLRHGFHFSRRYRTLLTLRSLPFFLTFTLVLCGKLHGQATFDRSTLLLSSDIATSLDPDQPITTRVDALKRLKQVDSEMIRANAAQIQKTEDDYLAILQVERVRHPLYSDNLKTEVWQVLNVWHKQAPQDKDWLTGIEKGIESGLWINTVMTDDLPVEKDLFPKCELTPSLHSN